MSQTRELIHPRDELMRTMERIYHCRMTTTSGRNILSILDDDGVDLDHPRPPRQGEPPA